MSTTCHDTDDPVLLTRLALSGCCEPGDPRMAALILAEGPEAVLAAQPHRQRLLDRAHAVLQRCRPDGITVLVPGSGSWPTQLDHLEAPPIVLYTVGRPLRPALLRSVSVVGSRSATPAGLRTAGDWSTALSREGFTVVSGGAFGIDAAAHAGAVPPGGTVAVLAAGVDVDSPRGNAGLLARIRREGTVVSEVPPGTAPASHRFLVRNRLIAALTPGTLVVEAALRSGALATARHAHGLHRVVMAVPGPVDSAASGGCHALIAQAEAVLVAGPADVSALLGPLSADVAQD